ncbi:hypothetical protein ES703_108604 [subsurface metagenome]
MSQKSKIGLVLAALLFVIGCGEAVNGEAVTIAEDGVDKAVIIVAPDASEAERHAAAELAAFLKQITGAKFEIVHPPAAGKSRLLVGLRFLHRWARRRWDSHPNSGTRFDSGRGTATRHAICRLYIPRRPYRLPMVVIESKQDSEKADA